MKSWESSSLDGETFEAETRGSKKLDSSRNDTFAKDYASRTHNKDRREQLDPQNALRREYDASGGGRHALRGLEPQSRDEKKLAPMGNEGMHPQGTHSLGN